MDGDRREYNERRRAALAVPAEEARELDAIGEEGFNGRMDGVMKMRNPKFEKDTYAENQASSDNNVNTSVSSEVWGPPGKGTPGKFTIWRGTPGKFGNSRG